MLCISPGLLRLYPAGRHLPSPESCLVSTALPTELDGVFDIADSALVADYWRYGSLEIGTCAFAYPTQSHLVTLSLLHAPGLGSLAIEPG